MQEWRANLQALSRIALIGPKHRRSVRLPGPALTDISNPSRTDPSYAAVLPAIEHIERHYNSRVSAGEIARLCGMSPFRFSREFHLAVGSTFQDHLLRYRVSEACRLIRQRPDLPIGEICYAVGFNDSSYFARIFKRYMNMKPSEFARTQGPAPEPPRVEPGRRSDDDGLLPPNAPLPSEWERRTRERASDSRAAEPTGYIRASHGMRSRG
jgi:AraC-like DNA-binding protein